MSSVYIEPTRIFTDVFRMYLPEPHASLLSGIVFGEKLNVSESFQHAIKITGLLHMVVLSGINITLLGASVGILTRGFGRKLSALLSIGVIIMFVLFVGADPPVTRAAVMGILSLVAVVYERKTLGMYLLCISAVIMVVIKPEWLTSVSFQLSCAATLGIMLWGGSSVGSRKKEDIDRNPYVRIALALKDYFLSELRPSIAAQMLTAPIIFWYFREVSVIAPLSNIFVAFAVPPIMIFGFLTAFLGYIHPVLGLIPAIICYGLLHYVIEMIYVMSRIPYIFYSFNP